MPHSILVGALISGALAAAISCTASVGDGVGQPGSDARKSAVSDAAVDDPDAEVAGSLLTEEFDEEGSNWEEFVNYWRLNDQQWHISADASDDGSSALRHDLKLGVEDPERGAHDALVIYRGAGADTWTDYRFSARAALVQADGGQFALYFRGKFDQVDQEPGRYVTGYYFIASTKKSILYQLRTDDECGDDCNYNYHFSNPIELASKTKAELGSLGVSIDYGEWHELAVEVEGLRIRCYIDGQIVFDYLDDQGSTFTEGSVGFFTYKADDARFDHVRVEAL